MNLWWYFDGLKSAQDLCLTSFLKQAKDRSAGLKLLLDGYQVGPNTVDQGTGADDYATHVLPVKDAAFLSAADVLPYMKKYPWDVGGPDHNTGNPLSRVFTILDSIVAAGARSQACGGSAPVYDAGISLTQIRELYFGQGGTAAAQGYGGLLWHFNIPASSRQALWTELSCAFDKLKGKAPGRASGEISFRYDFLSLLRAARPYLAGYLDKPLDRPTPADSYSSDWAIWVFNHSQSPCLPASQDAVFPTLTLADSAFRKGDKVEQSAQDDKGIRSRQFTSDAN
jgi:hypothetical protein